MDHTNIAQVSRLRSTPEACAMCGEFPDIDDRHKGDQVRLITLPSARILRVYDQSIKLTPNTIDNFAQYPDGCVCLSCMPQIEVSLYKPPCSLCTELGVPLTHAVTSLALVPFNNHEDTFYWMDGQCMLTSGVLVGDNLCAHCVQHIRDCGFVDGNWFKSVL